MSLVVTESPPELLTLDEIRELAKNLVTEDDEPVDNLYCAKLQRLLVQILYASWWAIMRRLNPDGPDTFLADANVGIYRTVRSNPLVPDVFLSIGVDVNANWHATKEPRCYFMWEHGKPPEMVLEIVSNKIGNELGSKLRAYARCGVRYYVVYDVWLYLGPILVRVYELVEGEYQLRPDLQLPELGLGLTLWTGNYEGLYGEWLRWTDDEGRLLLTSEEQARQETARANQATARARQEMARADQETIRADQEAVRAERLAAKLRELGLDPETL